MGLKRHHTILRGWLPQEPRLPTRSSIIQMPKPKALTKRNRWAIVFPFITPVICVLSLNQFSTAIVILIAVTLAFAVGAAVFYMGKRGIFRFFGYAAVFMLIFWVVFTALGAYFFTTSGYPPTIVPQTSYPQVLDASLTQYLQDVEESAGYRLLQTTHFGTVEFTGLSLSTHFSNSPGEVGGLDWEFYASDVNVKVSVGQTTGIPYRVHTFYPFQEVQLPKNFQHQNTTGCLEQIDALGLRWFHDQAVEKYKTATGNTPAITNLRVEIGFNEDYDGLTVQLRASHASTDELGNAIYPAYFTAEYTSSGTLLSFRS